MSDGYRVRWDGDETRVCKTVPLIVEIGQVLDVEDESQWRKYHGHCHLGVLECRNCHQPLYLQQQSYGRLVVPFTPGQIRRHLNQSDEHRALKDLIATAAERQGLIPLEEDRPSHGKRITDVTVTGGSQDVGWEIQLSPIPSETLRRRVNRAVVDGLAPSWLTLSGSSVASLIGDRAPTSTTQTRHALEYLALQDVPLTGVKRVRSAKCTGDDRVAAWHRGKRCGGWHAKFGPLITGNPTLVRMVEGTAFGQYIPVRWPRRVANKDVMIWLTPADEKRLWEIEERPTEVTVDPDTAIPEGSTKAIATRHRPLTPIEPFNWYKVDGLPAMWMGHCAHCQRPFSLVPRYARWALFCAGCAVVLRAQGTSI